MPDIELDNATEMADNVISNNVTFWQAETQTSMCGLMLSWETPNDVQLIA